MIQDVNRSNPCQFPTGIADAAIIENPCNSNEILIFGGYKSNDSYIYAKSTNTIKESTQNLGKPSNSDQDNNNNNNNLSLATHVVSGNSKHRVILIWTCYGIFNCEKMEFEGDISTHYPVHPRFAGMNHKCQTGNGNETHIGANADACVEIGCGSTVDRVKNWLFVFQARPVTVYDISDEYLPKKLVSKETPDTISKLWYHGSIVLESYNDRIKVLLFGCDSAPFNKSFVEIEFRLM